MKKIIKDIDGTKLYPVCGFQKSQHKLYYWENFYFLRKDESEYYYSRWELWQKILEYAQCVHDGLIYMPWKYNQTVKEAIIMYDIRH